MLARLQKKAEEPDPAPVGKSIQARIDLSDEKQIAAAIKHGFLTAEEAADLQEGGEGSEGGEGDEKPKRGGYFKDG